MEIRDATIDQAEEIAALLLEAWREFIPENPDKGWLEYLEDMRGARSRFATSEQIVAVEGGRVIGSVTFYPSARDESFEREEQWPEGWASIRLLGVLPSERGRGIGRALAEECIARARTSGAAAVGLHTTELMKVARTMYERMGFERYRRMDIQGEDLLIAAYRLML